ncbi:MAG: hypothetical protein KDH96_07960 [Candidatus Riesia sp.]|nr:hypothetical protein [Candidatus Riesia sp.]
MSGDLTTMDVVRALLYDKDRRGILGIKNKTLFRLLRMTKYYTYYSGYSREIYNSSHAILSIILDTTINLEYSHGPKNLEIRDMINNIMENEINKTSNKKSKSDKKLFIVFPCLCVINNVRHQINAILNGKRMRYERDKLFINASNFCLMMLESFNKVISANGGWESIIDKYWHYRCINYYLSYKNHKKYNDDFNIVSMIIDDYDEETIKYIVETTVKILSSMVTVATTVASAIK